MLTKEILVNYLGLLYDLIIKLNVEFKFLFLYNYAKIEYKNWHILYIKAHHKKYIIFINKKYIFGKKIILI